MSWPGWDNYTPTAAKPKRSKYGAEAMTVDGVRFASKKEAARYSELRLLEKAGEISGLEVQPEIELRVRESQQRGGEITLGVYRADFGYYDQDGAKIYEDTKGVDTPLSKWKRRHVQAQYGIDVVIL